MESCQYEEVKTERKHSWKPFFRQLMICSGLWNLYFICGLTTGAPTVIIPQLRREANSTSSVSPEMVSWLSSIQFYTGLLWVFILPLLARWIGRKYTFFVISICNLISFIVFYFSNTAEKVVVALALMGSAISSLYSISPVIITEYTSPKYRGIFLTIKSATIYWGIWVSNSLGTFMHWKTITILGTVCVIYNILTTFFWCKSPYWLASKQRYEECRRAHRWLKGAEENAEKELLDLIGYSKTQLKIDFSVAYKRNKLKTGLEAITRREFYKPVLLCIVVITLYNVTGKLAFNVYALDVIKEITSDESIAYIGMLVLDGISVFGMYCGCVVSKFLKRRIFLFSTTCVSIISLVILSLYGWLTSYSVVSDNKYVSLILLLLFVLSVSCGPMILSTSIFAELLPTRFKSLGMIATGLYGMLISGIVLKTTPLLFQAFGIYGSFLFFAITSSIFVCVLYVYLPETKDKTLQEIERQLLGE